MIADDVIILQLMAESIRRIPSEERIFLQTLEQVVVSFSTGKKSRDPGPYVAKCVSVTSVVGNTEEHEPMSRLKDSIIRVIVLGVEQRLAECDSQPLPQSFGFAYLFDYQAAEAMADKNDAASFIFLEHSANAFSHSLAWGDSLSYNPTC